VAVAGVACGRLDRVADGVPEVEDLAAAAVALVLGDDRKLEACAGEDRALVGRRRRLLGERGPFRGDAFPQRTSREQRGLQDLDPARVQLGRGQRAQRVRVHHHGGRLVVGADVVLGLGEIDPGLAPVGGVHLGHERGGHLHDGHPALVGGRAEAREVADDPAAERDQVVGAGHARARQLVPHALSGGERLVGLPRGDRHGRGQRPEALPVQRADGLVGDAERPRGSAVKRPALGPVSPIEQSTPDEHRVLPGRGGRPQQPRSPPTTSVSPTGRRGDEHPQRGQRAHGDPGPRGRQDCVGEPLVQPPALSVQRCERLGVARQRSLPGP
jgi:hypothetical protein